MTQVNVERVRYGFSWQGDLNDAQADQKVWRLTVSFKVAGHWTVPIAFGDKFTYDSATRVYEQLVEENYQRERAAKESSKELGPDAVAFV